MGEVTSMRDALILFLQQAKENWEGLLRQFEMGESDLLLLLHLILRAFNVRQMCARNYEVPSFHASRSFQVKYSNLIYETYRGVDTRMKALEKQLGEGGRTKNTRTALGSNRWKQIFEIDEQPTPTPTQTLLWRFRRPVTFNHFEKTFSQYFMPELDFPLLNAFMKK